MVDSIGNTFAALSDATRRGIVARLARGEATVGEIAAEYEMSLNGISKHVKVLEKAGLVSRRVEWRVHYIGLNPEPLREISEWLQFYRAFWDGRLDALEQFLAHRKGKSLAKRGPHHPKNRRNPR